MRSNLLILVLTSLLALSFGACNAPEAASVPVVKGSLSESEAPPAIAKNVIFLIGDGMGLGQITGTMYAHKRPLNLERFKEIGLHKSTAFDKLITDSAAGATAFACGKKTYNGAIGVLPGGQPCKTILEMAQDNRRPVGLVATSTIVHATPASFAAHQPKRKMYEEIALDMFNTAPDYFVGGGKKFFDRRKDERNLIEEFKAKDYTIGNYFEHEFSNFPIPKNGKFGFLTADEDPLPVTQGRNYLFSATIKGINFLNAKSSDNGFFLMVEGSQIDWGGHANSADYIHSELVDFDRAIGQALDFAEKDGNTLVVVTADHETGGYSNTSDSTKDSLVTVFTSDYHTATMVPVFAYGPGASEFMGIYDNTKIFNKLKKVMGL